MIVSEENKRILEQYCQCLFGSFSSSPTKRILSKPRLVLQPDPELTKLSLSHFWVTVLFLLESAFTGMTRVTEAPVQEICLQLRRSK